MIAIGSGSPLEASQAAAEQLARIVTDLATEGPTAAEIAALEARSSSDDQRGADLLEARLAANQLAFGAEPLAPHERLALVRSVTSADIRLAAERFGQSLVMCLPSALDNSPATSIAQDLGQRFHPQLFNPDSAPAERYSPQSWAGATAYRRLRGLGEAGTRAKQTALCSPTGLALVCGDSQQFVRWDEHALVLNHNDLALEVTSLDRQSVLINPYVWRDGQSLFAEVLRHSDPRLVLRLKVPDPSEDRARPSRERRTQPLAPVGWLRRWFWEFIDPASIGSLFVEMMVTLPCAMGIPLIWMSIWAPFANSHGPIRYLALAALIIGGMVGGVLVMATLFCAQIGRGRVRDRFLEEPRVQLILEERRQRRAQRRTQRA
jgi:hypothetical protein